MNISQPFANETSSLCFNNSTFHVAALGTLITADFDKLSSCFLKNLRGIARK